MGEIADAIRRAQGKAERNLEEQSPPNLRAAPDPSPAPDPLPASGRPPVPGLDAPALPVVERQERREREPHWVESIDANNPAVVPEDGPHAEICRHTALRLREELDRMNAHSVAVVSAERGDGKTTVACNLAIAMASISQGRSVALVDLDLRRPSLRSYLSIHAERGIEQVLLGKASLDDIQISIRDPEIDFFPAVQPQRAAHELIVLPKLAEIIATLEQRYATVIVDTPPAPLVPDARLVLKHVKACVPVVRKGKTRSRSLNRLMESISPRQMAGWVMNCDKSSAFRDNDYYYGSLPVKESLLERFTRRGRT